MQSIHLRPRCRMATKEVVLIWALTMTSHCMYANVRERGLNKEARTLSGAQRVGVGQ